MLSSVFPKASVGKTEKNYEQNLRNEQEEKINLYLKELGAGKHKRYVEKILNDKRSLHMNAALIASAIYLGDVDVLDPKVSKVKKVLAFLRPKSKLGDIEKLEKIFSYKVFIESIVGPLEVESDHYVSSTTDIETQTETETPILIDDEDLIEAT